MPFVTARVLARSLLERVGVVVPMPASSEPGVALISEEQATEIEQGVGQARLSKAIEIWADFVPLFGTCFEAARASEVKRRLKWIARSGDLVRGEKDDVWPCGHPSMSRSSAAFRPLAQVCEQRWRNVECSTRMWKES